MGVPFYHCDTGILVADNVSTVQQVSFASTQPSDGDLLVAGGALSTNSGSTFVPAVWDNASNGNYDEDVGTAPATGGSKPYSVGAAAIFSKRNIKRQAGTFTLSFETGVVNTFLAVAGIAFSGCDRGAPLDVVAKANTADTNKNSQVSGTTASTAVADAVAVTALCVENGANVTSLTVSGYTVIGSSVDGTAHVVGGLAYKILNAVATQSATWSYGANSGAATDDHGSVIAVYKGGANTPTYNVISMPPEALLKQPGIQNTSLRNVNDWF